MKVLITGANGFVGKALCPVLEQSGHQVIRAVHIPTVPEEVPVGDLHQSTNWDVVLSSGIEAVVHLAGKVPLSNQETVADVAEYQRINTLGTANLARQCAEQGVRRFIFVSTAKVLGEGKNESYHEDDLAMPTDTYSISKWEAEQALWQIAREADMEVVIFRSPLVYGPGVKGNFLSLMQAIDKRIPLPLGAIQNHRSMIYLGNLVDAIRLCIAHPAAPGHTFLVSDGDDISTPELIRRIAKALERKSFLLPVPVPWMQWAGAVLGKRSAVDRLVGSFAVDTIPIQATLGWEPPFTMQSGLAATAQWYQESKANR
jgi:nucleoside-diphosphate-sugar epimerase